jgi:L-threonylcarbamoyladenylate synthase
LPTRGSARSTSRTRGSAVALAAEAIAAGQLVVYPTDTLIGVAASARDAAAVARLAELKGRSPSQPISVAVSSIEEIESIAELSRGARRFVRRHLPGPYTLLVRPSATAPRSLAPPVRSNPGALGIRVPDHPIARELARRAGPITATSANRHGEPPCRSVAECRDLFGDRVAVYLEATPPPSGRPSTLIDLTGPEPRAIERR